MLGNDLKLALHLGHAEQPARAQSASEQYLHSEAEAQSRAYVKLDLRPAFALSASCLVGFASPDRAIIDALEIELEAPLSGRETITRATAGGAERAAILSGDPPDPSQDAAEVDGASGVPNRWRRAATKARFAGADTSSSGEYPLCQAR